MDEKKMANIFSFIFLVSAILLSPLYFYSSGLPQPGHLVMLVSGLGLIFMNRQAVLDIVRRNQFLFYFLLLVFAINISYAAYFSDLTFLVSTSYWVYGFMLLLVVLLIASDDRYHRFVRYLIAFKLLLISVLYLIGVGGYTWWPRYEYFFNGPNQLAYFVICMLLVFVAVNRARFDALFFVVYAFSIFIIISTGGRSAYIAIFPLVCIFVYLARALISQMALVLLVPVLVNSCFSILQLPIYSPPNLFCAEIRCNTDVSDNTISRIKDLTASEEVKSAKSVWVQFAARGYTRLVDFPEFMIYGAGQGRDQRFGSVDGYVYEIHSSVAALVFYYGVLGLVLFGKLIYDIFVFKFNLLFLIPVFTYGLFTYGLRSVYFWLALGFLALMPSIQKIAVKSSSDEVAQ